MSLNIERTAFQASLTVAFAVIPALTLALFTSGCDKKMSLGSAKLESDQQKASYAIGRQIGENMKSQSVTVDITSLSAGLEDALGGKESRLKPDEMQAAMAKFQESVMKKRQDETEKSRKAGQEFLEKNKAKSGVKVTSSGLQYEVVKEGTGKMPKDTDTVKVHYTGTLIDGTKFDSSVDRGEPAEFPVGGVIPGWTEALKLMKVGSKWKLAIPSELAYGAQGRPGIPPDSVLLFDVELLEIKGGK